MLGPLLLLGALEGLAYLWEQNQANSLYAWELVASRRMLWEQHPGPGAGYTLMQPRRHYEWQGIPVDINGHGLRGPETTYAKPSGTLRILNLGDSVAMGWGVPEADTYGRQLEALLNGQGAESLHYEVINAGVPGWNLENALAYLQAEGVKYEPDFVLLDITVVNDIKGGSALLADNSPPLIQWLRANTHFWPFLTVQLRWLQARAEGRDRIDVIDPPTEAEKYFPLQADAQEWTQVWNSVAAIDRVAHEHGARTILVLFPLEYQVIDASYSTLPQEVLAARAAEASIPAVDMLPSYQAACESKPGGPCQLEDRYLFADVWMHPSSLGHALTSAELRPTLAEILASPASAKTRD